MTPAPLADETIAAFVDGTLDPEEATRVAIHLADHPADRARADALFEANRLLALAFDEPMRVATPERLRRLIETGSGATVLPFRRRGGAALAAGAATALAASVALFLGVGGFDRGPTPAPGLAAGPAPASSALHAALETAPSGEVRATDEGAALAVVATFRDAAGRYCREIERRDPTKGAVERGLACRGDRGWTVEVAVAEPAQVAAGGDGFAPASGARDGAAALDAALDRLGAGIAFDATAEAAAMAAGWRRD
jgi:hypothetical protein